MDTYHAADAEKDKTIRYLLRIIFGLFLALTLSVWGWKSNQNELTLHYPPNLSVSTTMQAGYIPKQTVFLFTPMIYQQLMLWQDNALVDYEKNRYNLRQFLTQKYQRGIRDEIETGRKRGTLSGVSRSLSVLPSSAIYSDKAVQPVGNHWIVWLDVNITDRVNGVPVNESVRRLGLRVVRYDIDREANPWQLAIDGIEHDLPLIGEKEAKNIKAKTSKGD